MSTVEREKPTAKASTPNIFEFLPGNTFPLRTAATNELRRECVLLKCGTSPPGAAFSVMAEEDYILIGIAITSALCLVVSYGF